MSIEAIFAKAIRYLPRFIQGEEKFQKSSLLISATPKKECEPMDQFLKGQVCSASPSRSNWFPRGITGSCQDAYRACKNDSSKTSKDSSKTSKDSSKTSKDCDDEWYKCTGQKK